MHDVLLTAMIISIFAMFFEGYIVFRNMKNRLHAYLFLNCVVMIVNNTGYLLQLLSETEDAYIAALKFSYAGRIWILFSLFMFSAELCHIRIPMHAILIFVFVDLATYALIFDLPGNNLFYSEIWFDKSGMFPVLLHKSGVVHEAFMQCQVVIIIVIMIFLFRELKNHKGKMARKRVIIIIAGFLIESTLYVIQIAHLLPITYFFDISVFGSVVLTISMFIVIFKYNLLGIIDMAREYIVDRLSEGVIAVDCGGKLQYYNEHAKELYPEIANEPDSVLNKLREEILRGDTITVGDRYYTPEEKELSADGEVIGKLYALVDTTVLKQNEYKLKSDAAILEMAANGMKDRLLAAEEIMNQDRTMRHDRRHFEALILSLLRDGKVDDAKRYLEERLAQEPRSVHRYCENATVNAALMHYVTVAERNNIKVTVSTNVPYDPGVDEMQLAIAISNLCENAIHACQKLPEKDRFIEITAKYKEQLLFEIVNSCDGKVALDENGNPVATEQGHGIGTRSVLAFVENTDSDIRFIAQDDRFKVRMIIG